MTYDKFRIVIEFYSSGYIDRFDISVIEEVVDYLKEVGCKVPVLIYSDIKISKTPVYQRVMQLKKKYLMLFFTNDIKEVRKFCKMEHMRDRHGINIQGSSK